MARTNWRDRVELVAEVGIRGTAVGNMVWDVSAWDAAATWSATEPAWQALPGSEIEGLTVSRGRPSGFARNTAGTASLGLVWRDASGGQWSLRSSSPVQVGSELRIRAIVDGRSPIPVYRGTVRRVHDTWAQTAFRLGVELVDRLADLGNVDLPEQASAAGLDDLTHARVLRILDLAGINRAYALMGTGFDDTGAVHDQSSTFARNLLDEAMNAVESEAGSDLLVDRDGLIRFRRAQWWQAISGHTPNPRWNATLLTWANVDTDQPLTFDVLEGGFGTGSDLDDVRNHVSAARVGGSAILAEDSTSEAKYGVRTYQQFDLICRYDADVTAFANLRIAQLAERTERVDAIRAELDPRRSTADLEAFVDLELGDRHGLSWNDGAELFEGIFHVHGIRLRISPDHWQTELDLWAYQGFGLTAASLWGSAHWGTDRWQT